MALHSILALTHALQVATTNAALAQECERLRQQRSSTPASVPPPRTSVLGWDSGISRKTPNGQNKGEGV